MTEDVQIEFPLVGDAPLEGPVTGKSIGYVYYASSGWTEDEDETNHYCKIGFSRHPWNRLKELQSGNPLEIQIVTMARATQECETFLHKEFADIRVRGEWFKPNDTLFNVIDELLEDVWVHSLMNGREEEDYYVPLDIMKAALESIRARPPVTIPAMIR